VAADSFGANIVEKNLALPVKTPKPELKLGAQGTPGTQESGVAGGTEDQFVKVEIEFGNLRNGGRCRCFLDVFFEEGFVRPQVGCGPSRGDGLEHHPHGVDLLKIYFG
jgi:hypothetical protein